MNTAAGGPATAEQGQQQQQQQQQQPETAKQSYFPWAAQCETAEQSYAEGLLHEEGMHYECFIY